MNIIEHRPDIYQIENFLSENQQKIFLSLCTEDNWLSQNKYNVVKKIPFEYQSEIDKIDQALFSFFDNAFYLNGIGTIRKLTKGDFMPEHIDGGDIENSEPIVFGLTIYLNDNFTGGELCYTELDLKIMPKARSLVIHNAKYKHSVSLVESGNRYAMSTFIFGNDNTTFNKINLNN